MMPWRSPTIPTVDSIIALTWASRFSNRAFAIDRAKQLAEESPGVAFDVVETVALVACRVDEAVVTEEA